MKKRGIGVASMYYGVGYGYSRPDFAAATVEICQDGSVLIRTGQVDYGQGSDTVFAQIVAEELGIPYDAIRLVTADTATTPDSGPTSASRTTYVGGNAVLVASRSLRDRLARIGENLLGEKDLVFVDGEIHSEGHPEKKISFGELVQACYNRGVQIVETGWYNNTTQDVDPETSQGDAYATYCWATQLAEVEVDLDTGKVEVLRIIAVHDVGKAINPLNIEAQIEGGVVMGMGYALEERVEQEGGYITNKTLGEYMIPTSVDVPRIESHIVEVPVPSGPYGARGVGEPALIPTAPAILNAICNAIGIRVTELPANLENLHRLIRERERPS